MPRPLLCALTPVSAHPSAAIAIAAARAGGIGLLDVTHHGVEQRGAVEALRRLQDAGGRWGLRCTGAGSSLGQVLARVSEGRGHDGTLLLTRAEGDRLRAYVDIWRASADRILVEATSLEEAVDAVRAGADGVVAKGNEAGGRVAEETTFILLQRLLTALDVPVFAQGGIGRHTVAAAAALGAAGVVLDAQLLLTRESPLPPRARAALRRLDGTETVCVGGRGVTAHRLCIAPGRNVADQLERLAAEQTEASGPEDWDETIGRRSGWDVDAGELMPVGQDVAFAARLAAAHTTTGRVLRALGESVQQHLDAAARCMPLAEGSPLAASHGTRYPIVQGPMTRVSDQPEFARAVARAGALPFLALAMSRAADVDGLLARTARTVGESPWGVGILGFVPEDLRREQLGAIRRHRPPFALIAGGQPDQAAELEAAGTSTYLHTPSPSLLRLFLQAGARRFVFEGRECGGHVGPRSSFVLWDDMLDELATTVRSTELQDCHVLFAGGVHDAASAAAVSVMAGPLAARGLKVGVLMGTAYLFTREIVASGGVTEAFQQEAIRCRRTALLQSGPGYATRCARTPVVDAFDRERTRLVQAGLPKGALTEGLERFNLGRLRIAAKGLAHGEGGGVPVDAARQSTDGLFMMGDVAGLRDDVVDLDDLHEDVCAGSTSRIRMLASVGLPTAFRPRPRPADLAVVGMSCILPGAPDLEQYWSNILARVDAIREVPTSRWDPTSYFDADPSARDKTYSRWGGFLDDVRFDPLEYGMPPNSLPHVESMQLLSLQAVRAALADAGYAEEDLPKDTTCVVFGAGGGVADLGQKYAVRAALPGLLGHVPDGVLANLPEWSEDSFPGILLNVTAGRVANRFDLGGLNCTVDAACASSLAALQLAAQELQAGTSDVAVVGGVDTVQNAFGYLAFAKTGALSPTGRCRPFDASADGIAISEGVAVVVLKRLADAERDGDRVYAVIKGIGAASDGKARGLTAPRPEGQARAIHRAYATAGFSPGTVQLVEAHGTGTVAGDRVEVETLRDVFNGAQSGPPGCAIGSVKSMIGHTKCTAGMAGLIKVAKALHHKVLPPTIGVTQPNPSIAAPGSPFYVNTVARPWLAGDGPRRASVSAFGFGGTNYYTVLEEYTDGARGAAPRAGAVRWPCELFAWSGTREAVRSRLDAMIAGLRGVGPVDLTALAAATRDAASGRDSGGRLALVVRSVEDLSAALDTARTAVDRGDFTGAGVWWRAEPGSGATAFLYPGQGSQRPGMLADLAMHFPEVRQAFENAEAALSGALPGRLRDLVFPVPSFTAEARAAARDALRATRVAQPALGVAAVALTWLLAEFGARPAMTAGHSYGEYPALWAAGVIDEASLYQLSERRGRCIAESSGDDAGSMLAVLAPAERVGELLADVDGVWTSNRNSPRQTVVSGTREGLAQAARVLDAHGVEHHELAVAAAFHSPLVAPARDALAAVLTDTPLAPPQLPVYANATGQRYPTEPQAIRDMLGDHLVTPVRFADEIESLHAAGARTFVELGPGTVLTGLVGQILDGRPHTAIAVDGGRDGLHGLLAAVAGLWVAGAPVRFDRLSEDRVVPGLQVAEILQEARTGVTATTWLVNGGGARPASLESTNGSGPSGSTTAVGAGPAANGPTNGSRPAEATPTEPSPVRSDARAADVETTVVPHSRSGAVADEAALRLPSVSRGGEADTVIVAFQQLMDRFLTTNRDVMLAYLNGDDAPLENSAAALPAQGRPAIEQPVPPDVACTEPGPPAETLTVREPGEDEVPVLERLRELVAERTGYPVELLEPDLDLEADLGIDSIKRVEVIAAFQQSRPGQEQERLAAVAADLRRSRTLADISGIVEAALRGETGLPASGADVDGTGGPSDLDVNGDDPPRGERLLTAPDPSSDGAVPRLRVEVTELAPPQEDLLLPGDGAFVVVDDGNGVGPALVDRLERRGGTAVLLSLGSADQQDGAAGTTHVSGMLDEIDAALGEVRDRHGGLRGVIHLRPLATVPDGPVLLDHRVVLEVGAVTRLACAAAAELSGQSGPRWMVAAVPGGRSGEPLASAALAGLMTTLAAEWPGTHVRTIRVDVQDPPAEIADGLLAEILDAGGPVETARSGNRRWTSTVRPAPLPPGTRDVSLTSDSVVLLTGGARGITARLALGLARTTQPTLVLAGRTPVPPGEEDGTTAWARTPTELRRALAESQRVQGREPAVARLEQRAVQLEREREVRETLAQLSASGCRVEYRQVDVSRGDEVRQLVDDVYQRLGRLDAVVHGAGVVEDRLLVEKRPEAIERIVATKVEGALHLAESLRPDSLELLVLLTSVAGWFGNPGQSDYAAANRALDALAVRLDAEWPGRVVAMSWGPWDGLGMVTPEVRRQFLTRSIEPVPPDAGVTAFLDEIRHGRKGEHHVVLGSGPWLHEADRPSRNGRPADAAAGTDPSPADRDPFLVEAGS